MNNKDTHRLPCVTGTISIHSFTNVTDGESTPLLTMHAKEAVTGEFTVMILRPQQAIALAKALVDHAVAQQEFCVNKFWDEVNAGV